MPHAQTIAIVEDDASLSRAVSRLLRESGFESQAFASAEDLLASPEPGTWPCLILDLQLPGMSGLALFEELCLLAPPPPAIFITALDEGELRDRAARIPDTILLRKPMAGTDLLAAVRRQFHRSGVTVPESATQ